MNNYLKQILIGLLIVGIYFALRIFLVYILFNMIFGAGQESDIYVETSIFLFDLISIGSIVVLRSRIEILSLIIALIVPLFALTVQILEYIKVIE